jgi:hypothetical protein
MRHRFAHANNRSSSSATWVSTSTKLTVNNQLRELDVDPEMPLLWAIRDHLHLTGTKFGCGMALCGACTVHVDGQATRSCVTPVSAVEGKSITTIEGLSTAAGKAVQASWVHLDVPVRLLPGLWLLHYGFQPGRRRTDAGDREHRRCT